MVDQEQAKAILEMLYAKLEDQQMAMKAVVLIQCAAQLAEDCAYEIASNDNRVIASRLIVAAAEMNQVAALLHDQTRPDQSNIHRLCLGTRPLGTGGSEQG